MAGDLSCTEGQDGQGQDKAPHRPLIRNDSNKQKQAPPSSVTTTSQARGECRKKKWGTTVAKLQGDPDSSGDASESGDEGSEGSDSELRMSTGTEARQGLEEPITGSHGQREPVPGGQCSKAGRQCSGEEAAGSSPSSGSPTLL